MLSGQAAPALNGFSSPRSLEAPGTSEPGTLRPGFETMPSAAAVGLVPNLLGQLTGPTAPSGPRLDEEAARTIPRWHFAMLNDLERNNVYLTALERQVSPGSLVLDIGSGTGLLAMIAARANAGSVITCEANPVLAQMARSIIDQNGLSDRITVIPKRSTDLQIGVDLPRRADLIVSEIVDRSEKRRVG